MKNKICIFVISLLICVFLPFELVAQKFHKKDSTAYNFLVTLNVLYFKLLILLLALLTFYYTIKNLNE